MSKVYDFLVAAKPFYYATVDNGCARVRPFGFCMEYEGRLYFGMGKHKLSFKQTMENPNVEICACNADKKWIRIWGKAVLDDRPEVTAYMFEVAPQLKRLYNEETGNVMGLFYLENGQAEIADMKGYYEKITL